MTPGSARFCRNASFVVLILLLPVTGFVWGAPSGNYMILASAVLSVASIVAIVFVGRYASKPDQEISRLTSELEKSSAQGNALVESERQNDRIIDSLTARNSRLKGDLILAQTKLGLESQSIERLQEASPEMSWAAEVAEGTLPTVKPRFYSAQEFGLLAKEFIRMSGRYERAFTVARIKVNIEDRRREVGSTQAESEFKSATEAIIGTLRSADFASTDGSHLMIIGYPETSAIHVNGILSHLRAALKSSEAKDLKIDFDTAEGDDIDDLLSES